MAYVVYVGVLVGAVLGVPIVHAVVLTLALPAAQEAMLNESARTIITVFASGLGCLALAGGRVRGPVAPAPFVASTLGNSSIAPRVAWGRQLTFALVSTILLFAAVAALAVTGFVAGNQEIGASLSFVAGMCLVAVLFGMLWLIGQALPRWWTVSIGAAVAGSAALAIFIPSAWASPWSLLAALWPSTAPASVDSRLSLAVLGVLALVSLALALVLVERLDPRTVVLHAERWEALTQLVRTGDFAGAFDRLRAVPAVGRRVRIPLDQPLALAVLQRDAIGLARNPIRLAVALATLALALSGVAWRWMHVAADGVTWAYALAAGLLAFAALGVFSDGFRHAADTAGRPSLFRQTPAELFRLHTMLPALAIVIPTITAALAGGAATAATAVALSATLVAVRACDAAKGPMPIELLMPVPTPAGDASSIGAAFWQADALIIVGVLAVWLGAGSANSPTVLFWVVPIIALLALLTSGRLRRSMSLT
ncbi:hypothetical protein [Microbacterium sp. NPDC076911]|uniref:hypothetical protein n=1 Tax=Microbacterium sp. NPDC076911 TaxID=3154958 RepID=UPI003428FF72